MPGRITVVGLGPGDPSLLTVGAQRALDGGRQIILRTRVHPGLEDLASDPRVTDCDDLYEAMPNFEDVYTAVATRVCEAATGGDVVFAVPGHPRFGERSVALLEEQAARQGIEVEVGSAVSAIDVMATALRVDPLVEEVQMVDATELARAIESEPYSGGSVGVDPARPCVVTQVYARSVATAAKLALGRIFPDDHPVVIARAAGVPELERADACALFELDRQPVDHLTSVWLPAATGLEAHRSTATLQRVVARLRAPGGCPWDQVQTHESLRDAVIEEAYEVADAIDRGDVDNLCEELGDLMLQAVLHAQMAEEAGDFVFEDVVEGINRKLVRRHPHVFGEVDAATPDAVVRTWESVKAEEKRARGVEAKATHPLDRLPRSMPSLRRAAQVLAEFRAMPETFASGGGGHEVGDRLLAAVEDVIRTGQDPEVVLEQALRRRIDERGADGRAAVEQPRIARESVVA